jgi:hypothetical protein
MVKSSLVFVSLYEGVASWQFSSSSTSHPNPSDAFLQ